MYPIYRLPTFNLEVRIWRSGNPTTNPPDVTTICNLALGKRTGLGVANTDTNASNIGGMWLLLPKGTDIRDLKDATGPDVVEVPGGTGRFYDVCWVDDAGLGFANEHRFAVIVGKSPWPVPFPGPPVPPLPGALALVDQTFVFFGDPRPPVVFTSGPTQMILALLTDGATGAVGQVTSANLGVLTEFTSQAVTDGQGGEMWLAVYTWSHAGGTDTLTMTGVSAVAYLQLLYSTSYSVLEVVSITSGTTGTPTVTAGSSSTSPSSLMIGVGGTTDVLGFTNWPAPMVDAPGSPWSVALPVSGGMTLSFGVYYAFGIGTPAVSLSVAWNAEYGWIMSTDTFHP